MWPTCPVPLSVTSKSFYSKRFMRQKNNGHFSERGEMGYRRNLVAFFKGRHLNFSFQQDYRLGKVGSNLQYWKSHYLLALFPWGAEQVFIKGIMLIPRSWWKHFANIETNELTWKTRHVIGTLPSIRGGATWGRDGPLLRTSRFGEFPPPLLSHPGFLVSLVVVFIAPRGEVLPYHTQGSHFCRDKSYLEP